MKGRTSTFRLIVGSLVVAAVVGAAPLPAGAFETTYSATTGSRRAAPTQPTFPSGRQMMGMTYDAARDQVVLFGGLSPDGYDAYPMDDTWTWDGSAWTRQQPATSPPARFGAGMTYDAARGTVVLYGGYGDVGHIFADTWTWDGTNWTEEHPTSSPGRRFRPGLAYDAKLKKVVLWAGQYPGTWTWDGTNWAEQRTITSPPLRDEFGMTYDAARGVLVMFGGRSGGDNDTWTFNGINWTEQHPATSPPGRFGPQLAYDAVRQRVLLFGGTAGHKDLHDTWTWDGTNWSQHHPVTSPTGRNRAGVAFDEQRGELVLFAGADHEGYLALGDMWTWNPNGWRIPFPPKLEVSPSFGPPGTGVQIWGSRFGAMERVTIRFVDSVTGATLLQRFRTDTNGSFTAQAAIPLDATVGVERFAAKGWRSGRHVTAKFTVT